MRLYGSVMGRIAGSWRYVNIVFCRCQGVRLLLMAERYFAGGIVKELLRGSACWRRNSLGQYLCVLEMLGFGTLVSGGLSVMRRMEEGGSMHFR